MKRSVVPLLSNIVPQSPDSSISDPSELAQNMLQSDEKIDLGVAASAPNPLRYYLSRRLPADRVQRR